MRDSQFPSGCRMLDGYPAPIGAQQSIAPGGTRGTHARRAPSPRVSPGAATCNAPFGELQHDRARSPVRHPTHGLPSPTPNPPPTPPSLNSTASPATKEASPSGGLALDAALSGPIAQNAHIWEKVARQLRAGQMPPAGMPRPDAETYSNVIKRLEGELDRAAAARPNPGRSDTFRRLNRTEYQNAIRDLLAVEIDPRRALARRRVQPPASITSPSATSRPPCSTATSTPRRRSAASPLAAPPARPGGDTIRLPPDLTQENHIEGLPVGTRGGALIPYTFPLDGEYDITIRLAHATATSTSRACAAGMKSSCCSTAPASTCLLSSVPRG